MNTAPRLITAHDDSLRRTLVADGVVVAVAGLALALGAGLLADPLGLPVALLRVTGIGLFPYAAVVLAIATRKTISRQAAWAVVGLNVIWIIGSLVLLLSDWVQPTALGIAFIVAQALLVAAFADLEYLALRRAG